jgi:hypothetical protein
MMDKDKAISNLWRARRLAMDLIGTGETGHIGRADAHLRFSDDKDGLISELAQAIQKLRKAADLLDLIRYDVVTADGSLRALLDGDEGAGR